jgi:hypothetical protein
VVTPYLPGVPAFAIIQSQTSSGFSATIYYWTGAVIAPLPNGYISWMAIDEGIAAN